MHLYYVCKYFSPFGCDDCSGILALMYAVNSVECAFCIFMPLSPDTVSEDIMFWDCPSAAFSNHSFVQTDLVTTISREWLEQSQ